MFCQREGEETYRGGQPSKPDCPPACTQLANHKGGQWMSGLLKPLVEVGSWVGGRVEMRGRWEGGVDPDEGIS